MTDLRPGTKIAIPCRAFEGAFTGEFLVSFDTKEGPVTGFVGEDDIIYKNDQAYVMGEVRDADAETLTVLVDGSFFTTTGLTYLSPNAPIKQMAA